MRSMALWGKFAVACLASVAVVAGCKTTTSESNSSGGGSMSSGGGSMSADGGMGMSDGGMTGGMAQAGSGAMSGMADGGAGMAHDLKQGATSAAGDMKQGASNAAGDMKTGAQSAAQDMADAGMSAAGAARDTASGAATTAADSARGAMGGTDGGTASDSSAASAGAGVTDPQIAAIAVAANNVDIAAAKLAKKMTKNAKVKAFANDMIRDHSSANKQAVALVTKLGVTPEETDTSKALTKGGDDNLANLKTLKGKAFDSAYAEHEVAYHQQVIDALDKTLIPSAKNAELKSLLESVRGVVAQHLEHAKMMVDTLSK